MTLIEDILDMSRIMAGKMRLETAPVDLRAVAEGAISTVKPAAAAKSIEILSSFPDDLPPVLGDSARLQQVIWNLVTNAVKFTPRGGSVIVKLLANVDTVSIIVRDTGMGIPRSFVSHVFEPFRQQDSSTTRAHGGIGLGLAIVRSLVELHGGSIQADSAGEGEGSTFTVELPALRDARKIAAAVTEQRELPSLRGKSVLVIDDEKPSRDVVAAILKRAGATVASAESVAEAFTAIGEQAPDVVICDIAMPGEDGYDFLRRFRATDAEAPVIALTAFGRPEDRENALARGFTAYLKKPVDPMLLAETVRDVAQVN
jgi:CheY-like chemotaxis protein